MALIGPKRSLRLDLVDLPPFCRYGRGGIFDFVVVDFAEGRWANYFLVPPSQFTSIT